MWSIEFQLKIKTFLTAHTGLQIADYLEKWLSLNGRSIYTDTASDIIKRAREQTWWTLRFLWTFGCIIQAECDGPVELSRHIFYVPMCYTVTCNISEARCCENKYLNQLEVAWEKLSKKQTESLRSHIKPLTARREHRPLCWNYDTNPACGRHLGNTNHLTSGHDTGTHPFSLDPEGISFLSSRSYTGN